MNHLEKLLNGQKVEWKTVETIFNLKNGYTPSKTNKAYWENGTIPWFRMEDIRENGRILNVALQQVSEAALKGGKVFPKDSIIMATSATIGEHALVTVPYLSNQRFTNLSLKPQFQERFEIKFLFYYCFQLADWCKKNTTMSSFASVDMMGFRKFPIPIPPLSVQKEIVRILDAFTALSSELNLRQKQYQYYRDLLLSEDELAKVGFEWETLADIANLKRGKRLIRNELEEAGEYPVYQNSLQPLGYYHQANCPAYSTFIITAGAAGEIGYSAVDFWAADDCYYLECPKGILNDRFLYYVLMNQKQRILSQVRKASIPRLGKNSIENIKIPIPSLEHQAKIVAILDKFEALCQSISEGLPREMELRRKQYEYYRELLLGFDPAP